MFPDIAGLNMFCCLIMVFSKIRFVFNSPTDAKFTISLPDKNILFVGGPLVVNNRFQN